MTNKKNRKTNDQLIANQLTSINTELKDGTFTFTGPMTISEFAEKIDKSATGIVGHFFKQGKMYNVNHILDEESIAELCLEYGYDFKKESEVNAQNFMEHVQITDEENELVSRPPIITVMGHVDHGKTTLIDKIRNSEITATEHGGITQHTGAYQIEHKGSRITFLDTPGHEAFTSMRARGAKVTDIIILVVAADDGVMPQTKEAVEHAKAAGVPIIVFVNKMDKPDATPDKVISELSAIDVVSEDWGGDVPFVKGSALEGQGLDELFEIINLQAEMLELKANPNRYPVGTVVEARIDKGRGAIATLIVENGTLHARDFIVAGKHYGRIRTMTRGEKSVDKALPGDPVVITGLKFAPSAGDKFFGFEDEKFAKQLADEKARMDKMEELKERSSIHIEDGIKVYNIIVKADVQGTAEAVKHSLAKLENEEAKVRIVASSVGNITKSDILLAQASEATIFSFNIRPSAEMKSLANESKVEIKPYTVIYKMIEEVDATLKGMLAPKFEEKVTGEALIQKVIFYSKVGNIAGCIMEQGEIKSTSLVRLIRDGKVVHEGVLDSLQRGKDQAKKVDNGKDFGCHIKKYNDIKVGDKIEAYEMVEIEQ